MLTSGDEYLIHQSPWPVAHPATSDRNFYDRYFFNGYSADGEWYFALAMGVYPNLGVIDAAFSVLHDGRQRVVRASARLGDRMESRVGPIAVSILEPFRRLGVQVAKNEWGLAAELEFRARAVPFLEPHFFRRNHVGAVVMDYTRVTQHGSWAGSFELDGTRLELDGKRWLGTRDHSWGIRPVGGGDPRGAPPPGPPQFFWNWAPLHFADRCVHYTVSEDADGHPWHASGALLALLPGEEVEECAVEHALRFRPGTRHLAGGTIVLRRRDGELVEIELEPVATFLMRGIGYGDREWGHGMWKGELVVDGTELELSQANPLEHPHVQHLVRARSDGRDGIGVFELLVVGPHRPYGFRELMDPA